MEKQEITLRGVTIEIKPTDEQSQRISRAINSVPRESVGLSLKGMVRPEGWDDLSAVHVYVNLPDKVRDATPYFVAAVLLVEGKNSVAVDISSVLETIHWKAKDGLKITLKIVPSGVMPENVKVKIENIRLK